VKPPRTHESHIPSPAAIFRTIEKDRPTLLLDEVNTVFTRNGKDDERLAPAAGPGGQPAEGSTKTWHRSSDPRPAGTAGTFMVAAGGAATLLLAASPPGSH